jgi:hypothetical protein
MLNEPVTEELTEQLSVRPSRETMRPRDDHMILCSTFEFLFEFRVVPTGNRSKFEGALRYLADGSFSTGSIMSPRSCQDASMLEPKCFWVILL